MDSELYLNILYTYWNDQKIFGGRTRIPHKAYEQDIALHLDNVYADLQEQVNDEGGYVTVNTIFPDVKDPEYRAKLDSMFPPKIITPIRRVVV